MAVSYKRLWKLFIDKKWANLICVRRQKLLLIRWLNRVAMNKYGRN